MISIVTDIGTFSVNGGLTLNDKNGNIGELSKSVGSFSYSFAIPMTADNAFLLNLKESSKPISCALYSNAIYVTSGLLRIEKFDSRAISLRIYSRNAEWLPAFNQSIKDLNLGELYFSVDNVRDSQFAQEGAFWGVVNRLVNDNTLYFNQKTIFDIAPMLYIDNILQAAATAAGIELVNELSDNADYKSLVLAGTDSIISQPVIVNDCKFSGSIAVINTSAVWELPAQVIDIPNDFLTAYGYSPNVKCAVLADVTYEKRNSVTSDDFTVSVANDNTGLVVSVSETEAGDIGFSFGGTIAVNAGDTLTARLEITSGLTTFDFDYEIRLRVIALGEFPVQLSEFMPDIKAVDLLEGVLKIFPAFTEFDSEAQKLTIRSLDNYLRAQQQDLSDKVDVTTFEQQETENELAFANLLNYAADSSDSELEEYAAANSRELGSGSFEVQDIFLEPVKEFFEVPFAGSLYRMSRSLTTTLSNQNYFRENTLLPFDVSEVQRTTQATGLNAGDKFVIYPLGSSPPKLNTVYEIEAFEVVQIPADSFYNNSGVITIYSYFQNQVLKFTPSASFLGGLSRIEVNFGSSETLEAERTFSKVSENKLEPRILVAGLQVADEDITLFSPVGIPAEIIRRITFQREPILPKSLYFARALEAWTAPIYATNFSPSFDTTGFREQSAFDKYWNEYTEIVKSTRDVEIEVYLSETDYRNLSFGQPIYLRLFGHRYWLKEIQYKAGQFIHKLKLQKI